MSEQNNHPTQNNQPNAASNPLADLEKPTLFVDRSEKVKNFKVDISASTENDQAYDSSSRPARKGEVYFANYSAGKSHARSNGDLIPPLPQGVQTRTSRPIQDTPQKRTGQPRPAEKTTKKGVSRKAKRTKRKYSIASLVTLSFILISTIILTYLATSTINDILNINKSDQPVEVYIPENVSTDDIIEILHDAGLISRPKFCSYFYKVYTKLRPKLANPKYASGYYDLTATMGLEGMLRELHVNNSANTISLTFQEGWSVAKIFSKLEDNGICSADYLYSALDRANFNFNFIKELKGNDSENRYLLLEGYLFPDTYEFLADTNASAVIERFLQNFNAKWTDDYQKQAKTLGYSMDEIIIIASIIQREAGKQSEMATISSIIHNRLKNELSFPTLNCDSTADYILNDVTSAIGEAAAQSYLPYYDTYQCSDLPAGPVCNPGLDAIEAALYPDSTDYFYFLHDATGQIHLAKTFNEHQANVNQYLH